MKTSYIDTHAHLNLVAFAPDVEEVITRCNDASVSVINIGTKETTSKKAVELALAHENLYAIVGLHPIQTVPGAHDEDEIGKGGTPFSSVGEIFNTDFYRKIIAESNGKVVGIGECGFDYYRTSERRGNVGTESGDVSMTDRVMIGSEASYHTAPGSYEVQERAFITQIELANELQLPLMIHTRGPKKGEESPTGRSVYQDVLEVLKQYAKVPFNVHFYAGTYEEAKSFFEIGGTISFTGVITFAKEYEEIVRSAPLEFLHGETDCPFVAPKPYRGQRCEPKMVQEVYKKIAEIRGEDEEKVRVQLLENAQKLYHL